MLMMIMMMMMMMLIMIMLLMMFSNTNKRNDAITDDKETFQPHGIMGQQIKSKASDRRT